MKTKWLLVSLGSLSVLVSGCCYTNSNDYYGNNVPTHYASCGQNSDCACTDPHCSSASTCMDRGRCCKTFGNIGALGGDNLSTEDNDYENYSAAHQDMLNNYQAMNTYSRHGFKGE